MTDIIHLLLAVAAFVILAPAAAGGAPTDLVPQPWRRSWTAPPAEDRPLQIIHGIEPGQAGADAMGQHARRGLGGVVCNVSFEDYLTSSTRWKAFVEGVTACRKLGLRVWIYDEKGYPSGGAGGLALQGHPEYEATELVYDPAQPEPLALRPAYEFTHASNNFHMARRYINIIDDRAVRAFLRVTHDAYASNLGELLREVDAFFTDEPSLITVNLGQIPEASRKNVPVQDALDPNARMLPAVPWVYDLPARYREKWAEDLMPLRLSLFHGHTDRDRLTRQRYWSVIADLVQTRFFGQIHAWCREHHIASSGHTLWEESVLHHPTIEGSALPALMQMDIPGLDMLSSNPEWSLGESWMAGALPSSAALLTGRRRVMTEVSDFVEKLGGYGVAPLTAMQSTAAWQAVWGVTDFTLYYSPADRSEQDYRDYCEYVGRLNAILKPASLDPDVLLYYPVHDLWGEYLPVAERLEMASQTPLLRSVAGSFDHLGRSLLAAQAPFALADHNVLGGAAVRGGRLRVAGRSFRALVVPAAAVPPPAAARVIERFRRAGGVVLQDRADSPLTPGALRDAIAPEYRISPDCAHVLLGRFTRSGRAVLLLANVGKQAWQGTVQAPRAGPWVCMDPATGAVRAVERDADGGLRVSLEGRAAVILVRGR